MTCHSTSLLTLLKVPRHSKDPITQPGSLWGARVPAKYRPTRATRQIVAVEVTTPLQLVRLQGVQYYDYFSEFLPGPTHSLLTMTHV